jgi:hypothetical protein
MSFYDQQKDNIYSSQNYQQTFKNTINEMPSQPYSIQTETILNDAEAIYVKSIQIQNSRQQQQQQQQQQSNYMSKEYYNGTNDNIGPVSSSSSSAYETKTNSTSSSVRTNNNVPNFIKNHRQISQRSVNFNNDNSQNIPTSLKPSQMIESRKFKLILS